MVSIWVGGSFATLWNQ